MTNKEIKEVFTAEIKKRSALSSLPNVTKHQLYNWRHGITEPALGDMLEVLRTLGKITITRNTDGKPTGTTQGE